MNPLRIPTLPYPFITQEIIFSHRSRLTDSSSEASFLKLSEKNSLELHPLSQNGIFTEMSNRLSELENSQMKKLNNITNQIRRCEQSIIFQSNIKKDVKENQQLTYRKLKASSYDFQQFQPCSFEMDEHLNYVKNHPKEVLNQPQSNSIPPQVQPIINKQPLSMNKRQGIFNLSMSQNQYLSPPKSRLSQKGISTSRTKRKTTVSSCRQQSKKGRVYQQILSLYTTAKLLAMQKHI